MKSFIRYIQIHRAPCLHCGSFSNTELNLCRACRETLGRFENKAIPSNDIGPFPVHSFYKWLPGESDILSTLLISLKGKKSKIAWSFLAKRFVIQRMSREIASHPIQIVPAPSSDKEIDHAFLWAKGLATALGAEFRPCLVKSRNTHQRGATRNQRQRIKMDLDEKYSELIYEVTGPRLWVFVDDVLTTGSTAHAAYEALGCPENFEVWVLGHRSLSCEAPKSLL